jgi:hypothetical protein
MLRLGGSAPGPRSCFSGDGAGTGRVGIKASSSSGSAGLRNGSEILRGGPAVLRPLWALRERTSGGTGSQGSSCDGLASTFEVELERWRPKAELADDVRGAGS